jgi:hypothetical protein
MPATKPILNLSGHSVLYFADGTTLTTDTTPTLGSLPGQLNEAQLPTVIGAGSSLTTPAAATSMTWIANFAGYEN